MPFVRVRGSWMVKHPTASLYFRAFLSCRGWRICLRLYREFFRKIHFSRLAFRQRRSATAANTADLRFLLAGSTMSIAAAENFLRTAREQVAQKDINDSYLKAITELTREVKRLEDEIRRVRRDVWSAAASDLRKCAAAVRAACYIVSMTHQDDKPLRGVGVYWIDEADYADVVASSRMAQRCRPIGR